jgi:hypothetical protein
MSRLYRIAYSSRQLLDRHVGRDRGANYADVRIASNERRMTCPAKALG